MFKIILTIKKKKELSREEFINYYEKHHVPFILKHFPNPLIYRRNYIVYEDPFLSTYHLHDADEKEFDVITECIYETRSVAEGVLQKYQGALKESIQKDESNVFEPGSIKFYLVEAFETLKQSEKP